MRRFQRVTRARIFHHHLAQHTLGIGVTLLNLLGPDDEAKIARARFDVAESAVTARIKIDLASAGRDARVLKMRFERDQFWFVLLGVVGLARENACATRRIDRERRSKLLFTSFRSDDQSVHLIRSEEHTSELQSHS